MSLVRINDLKVGKTYQHYRNRRMIVTVIDRRIVGCNLYLILHHAWIDELQVCLTQTYETSKWAEQGTKKWKDCNPTSIDVYKEASCG